MLQICDSLSLMPIRTHEGTLMACDFGRQTLGYRLQLLSLSVCKVVFAVLLVLVVRVLANAQVIPGARRPWLASIWRVASIISLQTCTLAAVCCQTQAFCSSVCLNPLTAASLKA